MNFGEKAKKPVRKGKAKGADPASSEAKLKEDVAAAIATTTVAGETVSSIDPEVVAGRFERLVNTLLGFDPSVSTKLVWKTEDKIICIYLYSRDYMIKKGLFDSEKDDEETVEGQQPGGTSGNQRNSAYVLILFNEDSKTTYNRYHKLLPDLILAALKQKFSFIGMEQVLVAKPIPAKYLDTTSIFASYKHLFKKYEKGTVQNSSHDFKWDKLAHEVYWTTRVFEHLDSSTNDTRQVTDDIKGFNEHFAEYSKLVSTYNDREQTAKPKDSYLTAGLYEAAQTSQKSLLMEIEELAKYLAQLRTKIYNSSVDTQLKDTINAEVQGELEVHLEALLGSIESKIDEDVNQIVHKDQNKIIDLESKTVSVVNRYQQELSRERAKLVENKAIDNSETIARVQGNLQKLASTFEEEKKVYETSLIAQFVELEEEFKRRKQDLITKTKDNIQCLTTNYRKSTASLNSTLFDLEQEDIASVTNARIEQLEEKITAATNKTAQTVDKLNSRIATVHESIRHAWYKDLEKHVSGNEALYLKYMTVYRK